MKESVGSEPASALLVFTRAWPLLAGRMADVARGPEGKRGLRDRLKAALVDNSAWRQGSSADFTGRARVPAAGRARPEHRAPTVTAGTSTPVRARSVRALRAWTGHARGGGRVRGWWALGGRGRIGAEGLLLAVGLRAVAWRAAHLALVQVEFVLIALSVLAGLSVFFRAAVHRAGLGAGPAGPLVAPSQEVQRHAAREAGAWPGV
ncbi:hypothetical protein [Streptomyces sp. NPDC127112]|uniref:hypothetical protein n=1 Tax=Streptomyces sp. NPDC127112 TaxID=3345364 RepID=UPI00364025BF